jgi:hypothetical protein
MKRALLAVVALVLITASTTAPAFANGTEHGKYLAIAVQGLPDVCPAGQAMEGKMMIAIVQDNSKRKPVTLKVTVDTPFGDVTVFQQTFRMRPGTEHTQYISIPIPKEVPTGEYYFEFRVSIPEESLEVGHEVLVTK